MSNMFTFSPLTTMFQTSNIISQDVNLTDELMINLDYDKHHNLLNIFVKNTGKNNELPTQINVLSNQYDEYEFTQNNNNNNKYFLNSSEIQEDFKNEINNIFYREENEPQICIELSNIYVYDITDENENENENDLCQTMITSSHLLFSSSSSTLSSSCFDGQTIDNDDGYSTHSLDDIEQQQQQQQQSLLTSPSKLIIPFVPYEHHYDSDEYVSSMQRLIEQLLWLSPFKKTVKQMMFNPFFD